MISKLKFISIFLILTFLLSGCRAFTINNPLEVDLLKTTNNTGKFTAQTTDTYRLILEFSRKDISFNMAWCFVGDALLDKNGHFNPCANNELPINVEWEVHSYPENIIIASGKSNPTIILGWGKTNPSGHSATSMTRNLGTFQVKGGKEYKITAKILNATELVMSVSPKVLVETPGYFWP